VHRRAPALRIPTAAALLAIALAAPAAAPAEPSSRTQAAIPLDRGAPWRNPESWRQLRIGMSRYDVLRILGEPGKVTRYYAFERWEYPDALGERLDFDERGRLSVWGVLAR
jgi:outer membrane protein assembly factor BamE (lipoprotein component of BamABCDE complex)